MMTDGDEAVASAESFSDNDKSYLKDPEGKRYLLLVWHDDTDQVEVEGSGFDTDEQYEQAKQHLHAIAEKL